MASSVAPAHDPGSSTAELRSAPDGALELHWTLAWSDLGGTLGLDRGTLGVLEAAELLEARGLLERWAGEGLRLASTTEARAAPQRIEVAAGAEPNDVVVRACWPPCDARSLELLLLGELPRGHRVAFEDRRVDGAELVLLHGGAQVAALRHVVAAPPPAAVPRRAALELVPLLGAGGALLLLAFLVVLRSTARAKDRVKLGSRGTGSGERSDELER